MATYKFIPAAAAAYLSVLVDDVNHSCIYMGKERQVRVGLRETPLSQKGWPIEVQATINKHFGVVFSLRHEDWTMPCKSPRAQFLDDILPWTLEIE